MLVNGKLIYLELCFLKILDKLCLTSFYLSDFFTFFSDMHDFFLKMNFIRFLKLFLEIKKLDTSSQCSANLIERTSVKCSHKLKENHSIIMSIPNRMDLIFFIATNMSSCLLYSPVGPGFMDNAILVILAQEINMTLTI